MFNYEKPKEVTKKRDRILRTAIFWDNTYLIHGAEFFLRS
jgi:hypothetical protein